MDYNYEEELGLLTLGGFYENYEEELEERSEGTEGGF